MPIETIQTTLALAFLGICVICGEIVIRGWRSEGDRRWRRLPARGP